MAWVTFLLDIVAIFKYLVEVRIKKSGGKY